MTLYKFDLNTFDCVNNGVGTRWIKRKRAFEIYANARKISDQKQKCSTGMLLRCGGMHRVANRPLLERTVLYLTLSVLVLYEVQKCPLF